MKKDLFVFLFLTVAVVAIWQEAFFNFFTQDDFILINHFSQNNIWQDLKNVFGLPLVTHWRPIHNLYFLIAGNIFGKNYVGYHFLTFGFHIGAAFLIYKILNKLLGNHSAAVAGGLLYAIHPAHLVSLFWISGGATVIGFFFLIASIYTFLLDKKWQVLVFYVLALFASEAMIVGLILFYCLKTLKKGKAVILDKFLNILTIISVVFALIRFIALTPKTAFDVYQIELSFKVLGAIKYYLLRIAGFAEISGDKTVSLLLLGWLILIILSLIKSLNRKHNTLLMTLPVPTIVIGLLPFILIPNHLSPHYMNLSIFGFATLVSSALKRLKPLTSFAILLIFMVISASNINQTLNNNWVVRRSNLAKAYIEQIEKDNPPFGTTLTFEDSSLSTSREAYISLGTGEAIKFWFKDRNYKTCFSAFEKCVTLN